MKLACALLLSIVSSVFAQEFMGMSAPKKSYVWKYDNDSTLYYKHYNGQKFIDYKIESLVRKAEKYDSLCTAYNDLLVSAEVYFLYLRDLYVITDEMIRDNAQATFTDSTTWSILNVISSLKWKDSFKYCEKDSSISK